MKKENLTLIISILLGCLWLYAALNKLMDYEVSKSEMLNQVFPQYISEVLVWAVPAVELATVALLILPGTERLGLYLSLILLGSFSVYIAIVMTGAFGRIPCSCGGVLEQMPWGVHLLFNLFFLALTLVAINISHKGQPGADQYRLPFTKKGGDR